MTQKNIPSLNWLRVFEAAARTESFAHAAKVLNMSSSAISQQIRSLEGYLGKPLFVRGARFVALTREGQAFLPVVRQSLLAIETSASMLFTADDAQNITIQTVGLLAMGWLPRHIAEFEKEYPGVRVHILTADSISEYEVTLSGREPDIQIAFGSASDFPESASDLFGEELSIVGRSDVIARIKSLTDLDGVLLYESVPHQSGWQQIFNTQTDHQINNIEIVMVDTTQTALMMAAGGYGLALARSPASDGLVDVLNLVTCPKLPTVKGIQRYYLMMPEVQKRRPAAAQFRDWILDIAANETLRT